MRRWLIRYCRDGSYKFQAPVTSEARHPDWMSAEDVRGWWMDRHPSRKIISMEAVDEVCTDA